MTQPVVGDALIVSQSARRQLPALGILAGILCGYVVLEAVGVLPRWLMWLGIAVFGVVLLIGGVGLLRVRNAQWELRLDQDGLTVRGHPTHPWSDVAEVRVTVLRPRWVFLVSLGYRVVAFVGQPGVELPTLPSAEIGGRVRGSRRLAQRWYGSQLLLGPGVFDASTDAIVEAVQRFGDVPVVRG